MKMFLILLLFVTPAMACRKNCTPIGPECACDQPPAEVEKSVEGVSGKPDKNVKIDMPESLADKDRKADQDKSDADRAGKKAAGIN